MAAGTGRQAGVVLPLGRGEALRWGALDYKQEKRPGPRVSEEKGDV